MQLCYSTWELSTDGTGRKFMHRSQSQRGHHYLEGLDLLAWGGCHLGLSLQLDSCDTTLLLRTGTGRAWNLSGQKCILQDMRLFLWNWEGALKSLILHRSFKRYQLLYTQAVLLARSNPCPCPCPQNGPQNILLWFWVKILPVVVTQKFIMQSFPDKGLLPFSCILC